MRRPSMSLYFPECWEQKWPLRSLRVTHTMFPNDNQETGASFWLLQNWINSKSGHSTKICLKLVQSASMTSFLQVHFCFFILPYVVPLRTFFSSCLISFSTVQLEECQSRFLPHSWRGFLLMFYSIYSEITPTFVFFCIYQ